MDYRIIIPISKIPGINWKRMLPVSLNQYLRMTWQTRCKLNKLWYQYIFVAVKSQLIPHMVNPAVKVMIYFPTSRRRDWTNYTFKPIYDALVNAGVIYDDNDQSVNIKKPKLYVDEKKPRTEIHILGREES